MNMTAPARLREARTPARQLQDNALVLASLATFRVTIRKHPERFEEMNGGCLSLRAEIREKENSPEALSNFRAVVFSGF